MTRLRFWWRRRRAGLRVRFGERPSGVSTYSRMALLCEEDARKAPPNANAWFEWYAASLDRGEALEP